MLAHRNRFHGSRHIRRLHAGGQKARSRHFGLRTSSTPGEPFRAAVVVSKKVSKSAVVRNRIRRRVYEILRTQYADTLAGVSLVILAYDQSVATMTAKELRTEVASLLSKARLTPQKFAAHAIVDKRKDQES